MTSFNINQPSKMPQITGAQNMMNNGGGGNTGYLETGRKKKKKKEEEIDASILKEDGEDKFERSEIEYEDDDDYYRTSSAYSNASSETASASKEDEEDEEDEEENNSPYEDFSFKKENNFISDPNTIKDKFLGLIDNIGKIVNPDNKEAAQNSFAASGGDFLTLSKNTFTIADDRPKHSNQEL